MKLCETAEHWNSIAFTLPNHVRRWSFKMHWPLTKNYWISMDRCWASQAACWRQFLNIWTSRGLSCATAIPAPHMLSILFRPQVRTHSTQSNSLCLSLSLCLLYDSTCCFLTADAGFFGLLSGLPKELRQAFPVTVQSYTQSSAGVSL